MSKTLSSHLTASRKKRARRATRPDVDWRDAMHDHCFRLDMMAEVLAACGRPLEPEVTEQIGLWVGQEARALMALVDELEGTR